MDKNCKCKNCKCNMNKEFLKNYLNAYAPVAQEWEGQKVWIDYVSKFVDYMNSDNYGTAYGVINGSTKYKVVIEAHCDEISWMITNISTDGLISVTRHGGSDPAIALSKRVVIHTRKNGRVEGVFGWPAIHTRKTADEKAPKLEDLFIDIGVKKKKKVLAQGVEVGNIITFNDPFEEIGDYYVGRSLDNKIGGYIIAEVARRIKENQIPLPYDLYIVNSVQEEVGLYGAKMIAETIKPDLALVHDVCHHTNTPGLNKNKDCDVKSGSGPALEHTAQNHRKVLDMIRDVADANNIPYQLEVGSYGNDTMGFFLANGGIPTAIMATPLKYMHTTVEMANKSDVDNCIELFYQVLVNLKPTSFKYYDF